MAYVLLTAGWRVDEVAAEPAGRRAAVLPMATGPGSSPGRSVTLPELEPTPTLGISAATTDDLDRFIAATGTRPEVFDTFESWSLGRPLQRGIADTVAQRGARLSVTWEPWDSSNRTTEQPGYSLASITAGAHDAYIDTYAQSIKQYPYQVTIRLMHEMNGNWYPWGAGVNGNEAGQFVQAWRHVHDRFRAAGVTNVKWLWAPNAVYPGGAPLASLYPGDAYVDAVGISNYNWGEAVRDGFATRWHTFGSLFDPSIAELQALTAKPVWITEVASSSDGGSKAAWLTAMFAELQQRPEIAGVVWFSQVDQRRGVDWRIQTEADTAQAWREGFASRRSFDPNGQAPR
ncbi:MAG: glycosyl hydrolase [Actinomycetota bacterium]|nr:glycosyl hydrolase [Actinomycetota bacterium]